LAYVECWCSWDLCHHTPHSFGYSGVTSIKYRNVGKLHNRSIYNGNDIFYDDI
jgi:hypothetical protein